MRMTMGLAPLLMLASPAFAQASAAAGPAAPAIETPRALTDPATADRVAGTMQALSNALLNLPVGEVQAAIEGRRASPAERRLTVRDLGRRDNPNFDRDLDRQIAATRPAIEHGMQAMATTLPRVMKDLQDAGQAIERATANLPSPTYPKR